jgi:bacterioferritin
MIRASDILNKMKYEKDRIREDSGYHMGSPDFPMNPNLENPVKNEEILNTLNDILRDELTAIHQYMVQAEICANWKYNKLHDAIELYAKQEMGHAQKIIERMIFLDGMPEVGILNPINIGTDIESQFRNDFSSESDAIRAYNKGVSLAASLGDNGTRDLLESNLKDEEGHFDWLQAQLTQIDQMGIQNYLAEQGS